MYKFLILLLVLCSNSSISFAQSFSLSGKVLDKAKTPIIGASATIICSPKETNLRKGAITQESGEFQIENISQGRYSLEVSCLGYSKYLQEIVLDKSVNIGEVILEEMSFGLEDVVITAQSVERFADRKEYKLTNAEKAQYSSALSALEFLPKIQVLDQNVTTIDGKTIKILINGIPSTPIELASISPSNIAKIDYYTQPPVQYSNMGLGAVINVITKKKENGGSVSLNTMNAVTTGFGNNLVNLKYNFGRSQVGVTYNINYRNYDKRKLDEFLAYTTEEHSYQKYKIGKNGPYAYEDMLAEINFNHSKADDYLFSTKVSFKSFDRRRSSYQDIASNLDDVELLKNGESHDKDKYTRPVVDLYFSKIINKKHEIICNIVGTGYESKYDYSYKELYNNVVDFETETDINTDKYSLIGDVLYSLKLPKTQFFAGTRYLYNYSKQNNLPTLNEIITNEIYTYAGFTGMLGKKVNYNVSAGINNNMLTTLDNKQYNFVYFRPQVRLGYFINSSSDLTFNYEVNTENPSISNLTYNPYFKDPNYIYTGNSDLKPSNTHNVSLTYFKGFKQFIISAELIYELSKNAIAPVFLSNKTDIIETFGNLDYAQNMKANLFLQWYPFANNILRLRLYTEVFHQRNNLKDAEWNYTGYRVVPSAYLAYKKWGFQLLYQSAKKTVVGQTVRNNPSMAFAELSYKPMNNMTVMAGIRYPFYNSWKQTSETLGTHLISRWETERIINNANMVYLNFVYNFSFGKSKSDVKLKMKNEDKDSGILLRNN